MIFFSKKWFFKKTTFFLQKITIQTNRNMCHFAHFFQKYIRNRRISERYVHFSSFLPIIKILLGFVEFLWKKIFLIFSWKKIIKIIFKKWLIFLFRKMIFFKNDWFFYFENWFFSKMIDFFFSKNDFCPSLKMSNIVPF